MWTPQGNLIEMLRCGGAGLGGFLTPTGVGTSVAEGKDILEVDGRTYILEKAVRVDVALVRAHAGDTVGNLCHRGRARNYNPIVASCADFVIAEVEHVCCPGELDPEKIQTCGIFVDAVVRADDRRRTQSAARCEEEGRCPRTRRRQECIIAARAARELHDGEVTNLGAGIPMLVANYLPRVSDVVIQAENGIVQRRPRVTDRARRNRIAATQATCPSRCCRAAATSTVPRRSP